MANNKQHLTLQLSKNVKLERSNKFYAEKLGYQKQMFWK
jgi:hypothetical protein